MAIIPRSNRTNLPGGGSTLPSGSLIRINTAGRTNASNAALGRTIGQIGVMAQRANDNAEFKRETIGVDERLSIELARIKKDVQDPEQYQIQAEAATKDIINNAKVGFRNKQRFDTVLKSLEVGANKQIFTESLGKVADNAKATHTLLKDTVANDVASGKLTQEQGNAIVAQSTNELVGTSIFNQEDKVAEDRSFPARLAIVDFEAKFPLDPMGATKELRENKNISIEVRNNIIDKEVRKFNLVAKQKKEANRLDRIARVKDFRFKARRGEVTEDDVLEDAITHPNNPMSVDETFAIVNEINKAGKIGGVGNPTAFNEMKRNIKRNPDLYSIDDVYAFEDANGLNGDERDELEAEWEKKNIGKADPNDITTFRQFNESMKFTNLFGPSRFDVGAQLGVKKLRFDQADGFATARAIELYKTNKNIDSVMAQVEFDTLKHMQEYDELVQRFIDDGTLDEDETSIFEVKRAVEPVLKEKERFAKTSKELEGKISPSTTASPLPPVRIEAQLDEIEKIFDNADAEGRELTEDEIAKINEIQDTQ